MWAQTLGGQLDLASQLCASCHADDEEALSGAVRVITDTEALASTITGPTVEIRQATIDLFRNDVGRLYFNPTLEFIQDRLKSMGVYNAVHGFSGIDPNIIDDIPDEALDVYGG